MRHVIAIAALLLLVLCGVAFGDAPPTQPAYWPTIYDGLKGDSTDETVALQAALDNAATHTGYLRLDSGVYLLTDSIVVPDGVTFEGNQAKLQFEISGEAKTLCLEGNTKVSGFVIDVDSVTAITGHGAHGTPINVGEYGDGTGYSNIEMSDLTLHTEKIDGNGIFITGNSHDIEVTNIYFPNSVNMGRAILAHWGNTAYDVAEDTGRTYHPHNISISNITIDTMFQESPLPYSVGVYLSGCYNVDIENVNILQAGKAFHAFVGDVGFRYADPLYLDTSVIEGQGITLSGIFIKEATLNGFSVDGLSPILDTATGISDSDAVWDLPVHVSNSTFGSNGNNNGVLVSNCRGVVIDNCTFDGFASGFVTGANAISTKILNSTFRNIQNHGISLSNSSTPTSSPQDITVDNCFLYNNGLADSTAYAGIKVADASRSILTNNRIGLVTGEWVKYGILVTNDGAGHILTRNHVFDVSGGGSAYSLSTEDSTLILFWGNTVASGLTLPPPRVNYDTVRFTGVVFTENRFKTDGPSGIAADFKSSDPVATRVMIANTDTGLAAIYIDAMDGDFTGADYARIGQDDSGYFEFVLEPSAPNWAFRFTDATNIYATISKTALTVGAYALPMTDGTADQVLTTNGSGVTSWNTQVGAGGGESNTIQDTGVYNETEGFGLSGGKAGVDLHVKGLVEGSNITIIKNADSALTIAASAGGLSYWTESDDNDTSVFTATGPNTTVGLNDDLTMQGHNIIGVGTVDGKDVSTLTDIGQTVEYGEITATPSINWRGLVGDETGSGLWVFGTSPTFTTDITTPLVIGGTATTSDLSLKTTSGVGATGADMHFLVGNDGATEAMTILNNGNVGIGTTPDITLHLKADVAHGPFIKLDRTDGTWIDDVAIIGVSGTASDVDTDFLWMGKSTGDKDFMLQFNTGNVGIGNGIGVILPPEKLSVLGNIATGDTATGEVDVYHYFSTNGSWTTEYLMWDDNPGCFVISDALDVDGNILLSGTVDGVEVSNLNTDVAADSGSWNATADALGTAIDSTKTTNESMSEADLTISNAPTDEYALTWEASAGTGGQMTWEAQAGGSPSLEDIFNYMHPDIFDTTGFNDSIGVKANGITDGMVLNTITIDEASDVDTTGTKISAALADRLDDLMSETYKRFSRKYFDTLNDAANGWYGDTIICIYSDSTDLSIFDTDDLTEGSSNLYNQTHTGDVTGATELTIAANAVESTMIGVDQVNDLDINFGNGTDQVSTTDIPEGTNKYETFDSSAAKIRAKTISKATPTDNYIMKYDAALDSIRWEVDQTAAGGNTIDSALSLTDVAGGNQIVYWDTDTLYVSDTTAGTDNVTIKSNDRLIILPDTLIVSGDITVPANSISNEEIDENDVFTWTGIHTWSTGADCFFQEPIYIDDGVGDSPSLILQDGDNKWFSIIKYDAGHSVFWNNEAELRFHLSDDADDYIYMDTFALNVPMISTGGDCDLVLNASSGEISFGDENLTTTGTLDAGATSVTGNIAVTGTVDTVDLGALAAKVHRDTSHFIFAFSNPNGVYDTDSLLCIKPITEKAITITRIDVTCDVDPATEPAMKLSHTDNFRDRTSPTTIDIITTVDGHIEITSGFDDATIPASRCIYFAFTADPIAAIKSITVDITYTID